VPVSLLDAWIAGIGIPELLSRASRTALADASHLLENLQKLDSEDASRAAEAEHRALAGLGAYTHIIERRLDGTLPAKFHKLLILLGSAREH
jgi:hypothetical protein